MTSFLDQVVSHLMALPAKSFERLIVVLPSLRAGVFLKNKLTHSLAGETRILPEIISVEVFIAHLSELESIDSNETLLLFYDAYLKTNSNEEKKDFESFISWGQTLLQDFNEIDRYLINHNSFFQYLYYINDQKHWFLQENKTTLIENYILFWERLQLYYQAFTDQLLEKGVGYQGLQYRKAAENIELYSKKSHKNHLFVGFNALNNAEQKIITTLIKEGKAKTFWDADSYFFNDRNHDASLFLRAIQKNWKGIDYIAERLDDNYSKPKTIHISGVPKNIGQAKYVGQILEEFTPQQLSKTALVLADESLLLPILNSLPKNIQNINITMGLSLNQLPFTSFIYQYFELKKSSQTKSAFYYKNLTALLQNSFTKNILGSKFCDQLYKLIIRNNWVYVSPKTIEKSFESDSKNILLTPFTTNINLLNDLNEITRQLINSFTESEDKLQLVYIQKFKKIFDELTFLLEKYPNINTLKTLQQLLNEKLKSSTIDFIGQPFKGLQIMGVLESRCLDFETVILTSVNEGSLPSASKGNSFIPFDLKIEQGLPTFKEKDAIYAYHFYRLIQRCTNTHLIYNTQVDEMNSGEKSRFLQQLELEPHPNHTIISSVISTINEPDFTPITEIVKDVSVVEKLSQIAKKGFSPSALGSYLRNPLAFYEQYILGVRDTEEVEEEVAANTLGTVIHNVLENFYKPLVGKKITAFDIIEMQKQIDYEIEKEFKLTYSTNEISNGINYVSLQVAIKYISKFLKLEIETINNGNEIEIIAIESDISTKIKIPSLSFPVSIRGKVDRVDRFNGQLRIVDYKTGTVNASDLKIRSWDTLINDDKRSKALQILMYSYMYCNIHNIDTPVHGGLISFKKLNDGFLSFAKYAEKGNKSDPNITPEIFKEFLIQIEKLIIEICDLSIPFIQKESKNFFQNT